MNMLGCGMKTIKITALGMLIAGPTVAIGGGYGSAGVSDAKVGRYAAQAGIWCPALEATVPQNLYAEMDCGEENVARSAVAGERVVNRPRRGFLGIFAPHEPRGGREQQRDSESTPIASTGTPTTPTSPTSPDSPSDDPAPTPTATANVSKWDRMEDLGVTNENWQDQGNDFFQAVQDYSENNNDDWSDFNLPN